MSRLCHFNYLFNCTITCVCKYLYANFIPVTKIYCVLQNIRRERRGCESAVGQSQHETRIPHSTVSPFPFPLVLQYSYCNSFLRYYKFRGVAYPDLVQEGTFGLIKAVDKYDPDRGAIITLYPHIPCQLFIAFVSITVRCRLGFRFSTYASWWIKQSVSRSIAEKSRIIRLPVHIHDMMV